MNITSLNTNKRFRTAYLKYFRADDKTLSGSKLRNTKQRNPTKTPRGGTQLSLPLFFTILKILLARVRPCASSYWLTLLSVRAVLRRSVFRCVGTKSSETNFLTGKKVNAGPFQALRGTHEGKETNKKNLFLLFC